MVEGHPPAELAVARETRAEVVAPPDTTRILLLKHSIQLRWRLKDNKRVASELLVFTLDLCKFFKTLVNLLLNLNYT